MQQSGVNKTRRRFLIATTSVVGGAGVISAAVPMLSTMLPSERAKAAGASVEVDISKLEVGQRAVVEWRRQPVWIIRRPKAALDALEGLADRLVDPNSERLQQPEYAQNLYRSRNPELLVMVGICTHLGCSPSFFPEMQPQEFDAEWAGGFFCPCHGSKFDLSGRVYAGAPAPTNLVVPPYKYINDDRIVIGDDKELEAA